MSEQTVKDAASRAAETILDKVRLAVSQQTGRDPGACPPHKVEGTANIIRAEYAPLLELVERLSGSLMETMKVTAMYVELADQIISQGAKLPGIKHNRNFARMHGDAALKLLQELESAASAGEVKRG